MNKLLRKAAALLCAAMLAVTPVYAVEPLELKMEGVTVTDGGLLIYCNTNAETMPRAEHFTSTLGNTPLSVNGVTSVAGAGAGTSYIFLVDVSGSIRATHFQAIKDTIAAICEGLSDKDNISIFAIGDATYTQPFVSSPEDIQAQIDGIERSREDTNLYESVFTSLAVLNTHADSKDKKALVVFSDGEEDIFDGITLSETESKIRDARIPIYTIAMLGKNPASRYVESAKVLGSFARLSAGGRHYIHDLEQARTEEIAAGVLTSIQNGLIVSVGLDGFRSNGEDMTLRLELNIPDVGSVSDGYAISTAGLSAPDTDSEPEPTPEPGPDPTPEPTPDSEPEPTPEPEPEPSFFRDNLLWFIIGGGVLLLGLVLLLTLRRKKPAETPPEVIDPEPFTTAPMPATAAVVRAPAPPPGKPRIALRLTKVGLSEEQVFRAEFAGEIVLGRDPSKASLPFKDDELLSGRHCSISYEQDGIILRDLGSTNKTFVNGVPIQDKYILENDDVLLVGSMELRVNWERL